jgi:hypothetical protein
MLLTVGLAIDIEVSKRSELGGDLAQAVPLSLLGLARCSRLASATTSGRASMCDCRPSTLPWALLRSRAAFSFFTSREHAHDLAHGDPEFIVTVDQVVAGGGQDPHTEADQQRNAGLLGQQMPGKPAGIFDDDDPHAIADHPFEEWLEAWPALDRLLGYSRVVEFADKSKPARLAKPAMAWRMSLSLTAPTLAAELVRR